MKDSNGLFNRHRRAFSVASLGLTALVLVACGSDDEEKTPTAEPTAPVEQTVATGEPTVADEATQAAATAVTGVATPAVIGPNEASPVASPVMGGVTTVGSPEAATPVGAAIGSTTASPEAATPIGAAIGATTASPEAATPVGATTMATAVASPIEVVGTPAEIILASPVASPAASPVTASPEASPADGTPAANTGGSSVLNIPVVFFEGAGD